MKAEIEKILFDHFFKPKSPEEPWYQAEAYPKRTCQKAAAEIERLVASEHDRLCGSCTQFDGQLAGLEARLADMETEIATMRSAIEAVEWVGVTEPSHDKICPWCRIRKWYGQHESDCQGQQALAVSKEERDESRGD